MNSSIENKEFTSEENLPLPVDAPPKAVKSKIAGVGTGVLLTGGAVLGCFALALWNRKALMSLVRNRGHRPEPEHDRSGEDADAIY